MAFFRQKIKQKLIEKQHNDYKNEISLKKITYDKWIAEQEKTFRINNTIYHKIERCQLNDLITEGSDRENKKNEGNMSDKSEKIRYMSVIDQNSQVNEKTYFAHFNIKEIYENKDSVFEVEKLDYIVLSMCKGQVTENAYALIYEQFQNRNVILVYGDEDLLEKESGLRKNPWLKPDWSPDRFLSSFYFGGLVAARRKELQEAYEYCKNHRIFDNLLAQNKEQEWLYLLIFEMLNQHDCFAKRKEANLEKVQHIKHVLYSDEKDGYEQMKPLELLDFSEKILELNQGKRRKNCQCENTKRDNIKQTLSIIIPSKDNPEVLFHCLDSLLQRTRTTFPFEIVLVDNGSKKDNREKISEKVRALNDEVLRGEEGSFRGCKYLYEQMDFNFSKMCNLGAENATGRIFLFLNDDMEIIQPEWMDLMLEKAMLPYAGAVGAKLLYPDSDIIQHAGVTNLRVGPAHKLQYLSDREEHYFGMNRGVHNMLAVTGACLMVRREVFWEVGGFCEELAVAFNDVDLCYSIYEKGYYNIERNDVKLYHHESLSRGKDGESEEKQLRHLKEKDLLYDRHLELYGKDPFYHPYLLNDMLDSQYSMAYSNQVTLDMAWSKLVPCEKALEKAREDKCLVVGMECARDIYRWLYNISPKKNAAESEDMGYYFQGYSFIIGADNACYKKKFLLKNRNNNQVMAIGAEARYRQDIENNLPDQVNVGLTGFAAKLPKGAVPAGIYQFGILAEDKCSRQKLVNWSNWVMEVETDGRQSVREGKE